MAIWQIAHFVPGGGVVFATCHPSSVHGHLSGFGSGLSEVVVVVVWIIWIRGAFGGCVGGPAAELCGPSRLGGMGPWSSVSLGKAVSLDTVVGTLAVP